MEFRIDIALVCKSWLQLEKQFKTANCDVYRTDSATRRDGAAFLVKKIIKHAEFCFPDNSLEPIGVIMNRAGKLVLFVACYNPPCQAINALDIGTITDPADPAFV